MTFRSVRRFSPGEEEPLRLGERASGLRRVKAGALDYLLVTAWLGVLGLVGLALQRAGLLSAQAPQTSARRLGAQVLVSLVLTLPVTLWLAWCEANRGATPGKRLLGLEVDDDDGGRLPFRRAALRSAVKVALPWELAHAALWQTVGRRPNGLTLALCGLAYAVVGAHLLLVLRGGRPVYDRLARATVRSVRERKL